jgi:MoaA/NifB/PqqE/SkfB family radical SAM enzyme
MDKPYSCVWELLHVCNYRCPYCLYPWEVKEIAEAHRDCTAEQWISFWRKLFEKHGSFEITLTGGEPSVHAGFFDFVEKVGEWHRLRVNTNLSWDVEEALRRWRPGRLVFSASFHPQFAKAEDYLAKASRLRRAGFDISTLIVAYPPAFDELSAYADRFKNAGLTVAFNPFNGAYNGKIYPAAYGEAEKAWLTARTKQDKEVFQYKLGRSPKGRMCDAGSKYFRAYPNGDVFRCAPVIEMGHRPLGNIKDPDFRLADDAAPCPAEKCSCVGEYLYLRDVARIA